MVLHRLERSNRSVELLSGLDVLSGKLRDLLRAAEHLHAMQRARRFEDLLVRRSVVHRPSRIVEEECVNAHHDALQAQGGLGIVTEGVVRLDVGAGDATWQNEEADGIVGAPRNDAGGTTTTSARAPFGT